MSDWQPINTYPKGKTVLVAYIEQYAKRQVVTLAQHFDKNELENEEHDGGYAPAGWYEVTYEGEVYPRLTGEPTHWQPRPAPPSRSAPAPSSGEASR